MERFDAIIIGAGAAGMFCSALAGQAGRRVLLIDNGKKTGRKILMSGGGRCNFTNLYVEPCAYLSQNPHFVSLHSHVLPSGISLIWSINTASPARENVRQLFCDDSAQQIVDMLVDECEKGNVTFRLRSEVLSVAKDETGFTLDLNGMTVGCEKLVIATGGLSMPGWARRRLVIRLPNNLASTCCRPARVWCHSLCINRCSKSYRCWRAWRCLP